MEHHIITTERDHMNPWGEVTIEQQQEHQNLTLVGGGGGGGSAPGSEDHLEHPQKSRRSLTEAERGLHAEPNALRPATTKAGKHRIRMKWSNEVNQWIMRTYYTITNNETVTKSYRDHLHRLFAAQYPDVSISQQRIADQRRAIVKNNLLSKAVLDAIKEEVAESLQLNKSSFPTQSQQSHQQQQTPTGIIKQETNSTSNPLQHPHLHLQQHHHQNHHHHHHLQQQQQPQHTTLTLNNSSPSSSSVATTTSTSAQSHHPSTIALHGGGSLHHTTTTRIHQASPTTAAALQNQPHIIIRVNSTHGGNL